MKMLKQLFALAAILFLLGSCEKEYFNDTAFVTTDAAPKSVSAMFSIAQDNSGNVTITPLGEGVYYYMVYFGDNTTEPVKVLPGHSIEHTYTEGNFPVKVVAYSPSGKTSEATQQLTVSFFAPQNLEVNVALDPANNFKVNVSATADYETSFKVFFGETPNEVPQTFLEGQTVSHTYASTGTYQVIVVAISGGTASTSDTTMITIVNPVLLPLDFENASLNYTFQNFDGGVATVVDNPHPSGINTSSKVGKMVKNPGQVWGGSWIGIDAPLDFTNNHAVRMKVWSPRVGAKVLFKVENAANPGINFEKEVLTTVANQWEDLAFDFGAINAANEYNHIVLIFDLGTMGDGSDNFTFYFDDIRLTAAMPATEVGLPLTLENPALNYNIVNFDGGDLSVVNNPQPNGINTSTKVLKMVKSAGQTWGGSFITLDNPIPYAASGNMMKMKVWSPRVGAKVLLKVENLTNGGINFEQEKLTTVANQWEEITFDYSAINTANTYQKIVLIFDNGTMGDGSSNFTFYVDDISLN